MFLLVENYTMTTPAWLRPGREFLVPFERSPSSNLVFFIAGVPWRSAAKKDREVGLHALRILHALQRMPLSRAEPKGCHGTWMWMWTSDRTSRRIM